MLGCAYVLFKYLLDAPAADYTAEIAFGLMFPFVISWPTRWLLHLAGYVLTPVRRHVRPASVGSADRTPAMTGIGR
jgi:hypothetical protein